MWVFRKNDDKNSFEVGYFDPKGSWWGMLDTPTWQDATKLINYLNGGRGK